MTHEPRNIIKSVRLPSVYEVLWIFSSIPNIPIELDEHWWLFTYTSSTSKALCVNPAGDIVQRDMNEKCGIRPLFCISGTQEYFVPGSKYHLCNCICTAIDRSCLFADNIVTSRHFDVNSSIIEECVLNALKF